MDWLTNINNGAVVLVPTRGLQHSLSQQYAIQQIAAGRSVWQTPQILVWDDYIEQLWNANKHTFENAYVRLDTAQAFLVWQQVIVAAKKKDDELVLLNEQQTASVVQRSWKLMHKWRTRQVHTKESDGEKSLREDIDSKAFTQWCQDYAQKLSKNNWIDSVQLENVIIDSTSELNGLPAEIIFAYFDLVTSNQKIHIHACQQSGVFVQQHSVDSLNSKQVEAKQAQLRSIHHWRYQNEEQELKHVCQQAKHTLETEVDAKIGIVIPQLSEQRARIDQIARAIFYPDKSPLECQQQDLAYRFSLGRPLNKIAYVHAMLTALALMKNTFRYQELSFLLLSEWWPFHKGQEQNFLDLNRALKQNRCAWLSWETVLEISQKTQPEAIELHDCFQSLISFREKTCVAKGQLSGKNNSGQFKRAREWQSIFSEWLKLLSWQENDLDSWHYQAHESWLETLEVFVGYDLVQGEIGLSRALRSLNSLCLDKVYMRQAKAEPILISGVLEGIGQQVDYLFVTGMHETYPPPMKVDPFISSMDLEEQDYPFADKATEFRYEQNKLESLLAGGNQVHISYASQQLEGEYTATTLLRDKVFIDVEIENVEQKPNLFQLEEYTDTQGQACMNSAGIRGGSKVFENQSNCPFKAYVEHRILRQIDDEPEFGLDARDAGVVVHSLLENIWRELGSYSTLSRLGEQQLKQLISRHVESYLNDPAASFQYDRKVLLQLEKPRLNNLLFEWLVLEQEQRSLAYSVIGRETSIQSEFGGIPINLVVDRIDQTDSGECIVIDYKTGQAELSVWQGERPKTPQMPLYALALDKHSQYNIKGIAFAKVKTNECSLLGVTEIEGVGAQIKTMPHTAKSMTWQQQIDAWHENLSHLAAEFLEGFAAVEPLKVNTCDYCDLDSLCRINQLRVQTGQGEE
jgi:probable DNA repair protein